ncbi:ferritin-like domain-containing protein [Sphingomonas immobilis]|uniref:Ferritin-like domain-containing protein n=1 Tax=Sphingomonas immobilis TaxID=3063997 RepID=A0ABT8ZWR3_9SPHN|nr:ferritin-like domain-containing protein [Sphingomonas sp. CA1-15]MDO7841989.1 ferritin-like domain-containing protein [Sphingomonas sp. CA1-15]
MTSISVAIRQVLEATDPYAKVKAARAAARGWRKGAFGPADGSAMPDRPGRPAAPELLAPNLMPRRGKAGSQRARIALLHALAHIEFIAIDLAFDMAGRFGASFPDAFTSDWLAVGADEAMHFALLDRRLRALGSHYGALPAHDGLWEAAAETAHDPLARLAIVPMVLEARGLDVTPDMIARADAAGDVATARILRRIFEDEIRHVGAGTKWFEYGCNAAGEAPGFYWRALVGRHFRGSLKPPFNDSARRRAGLTRDYYQVLASLSISPSGEGVRDAEGLRPGQ